MPISKTYDLDLDQIKNQPSSVQDIRGLALTIQPSNVLAEAMRGLQNSIAFAMKPVIEEPLGIIHKAIKEIAEKAKEIIKSVIESFRKAFKPLQEMWHNFIGKTLDPIFDIIRKLRKSNFFLIVKASEGDRLALHQLGKLWWKLMLGYLRIEKIKGRSPTKEEFEKLVQETCWKVLKKEGQKTSWFDIAKKVYFAIIAQLVVDYAEVCIINKKERKLNVDVIDHEYKSSLSIYYGKDNEPHLFVKTVAQELGVSVQTIRNWINSGKVNAIKISYISRIRHATIPAYLLPYKDNILKELEDFKKQQEDKKLHRIEGYLTISQIAKAIGVSRKTLERWDKEGKLKPKRINNIRYYSREEVLAILLQSQSPKVRAFIQEKNLAPVLAS
jgi:transposase